MLTKSKVIYTAIRIPAIGLFVYFFLTMVFHKTLERVLEKQKVSDRELIQTLIGHAVIIYMAIWYYLHHM